MRRPVDSRSSEVTGPRTSSPLPRVHEASVATSRSPRSRSHGRKGKPRVRDQAQSAAVVAASTCGASAMPSGSAMSCRWTRASMRGSRHIVPGASRRTPTSPRRFATTASSSSRRDHSRVPSRIDASNRKPWRTAFRSTNAAGASAARDRCAPTSRTVHASQSEGCASWAGVRSSTRSATSVRTASMTAQLASRSMVRSTVSMVPSSMVRLSNQLVRYSDQLRSTRGRRDDGRAPWASSTWGC